MTPLPPSQLRLYYPLTFCFSIAFFTGMSHKSMPCAHLLQFGIFSKSLFKMPDLGIIILKLQEFKINSIYF